MLGCVTPYWRNEQDCWHWVDLREGAVKQYIPTDEGENCYYLFVRSIQQWQEHNGQFNTWKWVSFQPIFFASIRSCESVYQKQINPFAAKKLNLSYWNFFSFQGIANKHECANYHSYQDCSQRRLPHRPLYREVQRQQCKGMLMSYQDYIMECGTNVPTLWTISIVHSQYSWLHCQLAMFQDSVSESDTRSEDMHKFMRWFPIVVRDTTYKRCER